MNMVGRDDEYTMPTAAMTEDNRLRFLREAVISGETFIRNQPAAMDFDKAKNIISGWNETKIPQQLSRVNVNLTKRLIRDVVSTMSNLRPLWGYKTDNPEQDTTAAILNKLLISWYQTSYADRIIKKALQYAAVYGTGYLGPDWKKDHWTRGRGEIVLKAYSPENVIPYQVPDDGDIQRAYIVTFREEVPINLARAMFPTMAEKIQPDRVSPSGLRRGLGKMASFLSPVLNRFGAQSRAKKSVEKVFPVVDMYQSYILDLSINLGPEPRVMGEPGTYWNYIVPALGHPVKDPSHPGGWLHPATGQPVPAGFRPASVEDAMLYPFRRLVTWCQSTVLRDGPSYWWHGMVPAVKIRMDSWAWEFLGFSMTRDLSSIDESSNTIRRAIDDSTNARLRPPLMYDEKSSISQGMMESLDIRVPGQAIGVDFTNSENPIRPIVPVEFFSVPDSAFKVIAGNDETMKYIAGVNDMTAITKAAQLPSSDTVEKIFEQAGPMVTDISRNLEAELGPLGEMIKCMFFEFYTVRRRIEVLGNDGVTQEDSTYFDPGSMVPSHLPGENPEEGSIFSVIERARRHMDNFYFQITPNSLHQITQMSRKLLYIQLQKAGIPMDPWTLAEVMDIPNFGRPPKGANTVMERWVAYERMKGEMTAFIQAKTQEIMMNEQMKQQMGQMSQMAQAASAMGVQPGGQQAGPAGPAGGDGGEEGK